jgi:hypothetical protein
MGGYFRFPLMKACGERSAKPWDSLNSREHVLVIRALIERAVIHDGKVGRVMVRFPSTAVRKICRGTGKERVRES